MRSTVIGLCLFLAVLSPVRSAEAPAPPDNGAPAATTRAAPSRDHGGDRTTDASAAGAPNDRESAGDAWSGAGEAGITTDAAAGTAPAPVWSRRNIFKRIASDQKFLVTTWWPGEFHRPGFAVPLVGSTAAAILSGTIGGEDGPDIALERNFKRWTRNGRVSAANTLTRLGNPLPVGLGLGASWLVGRWTHNERLQTASSLAVEAEIDATIWAGLLKNSFGRLRPSSGEDDDIFRYSAPAGRQTGSLPSGHAISTFAGATVLTEIYADKRWAPWVFYGAATLISASRVGLGRHYPTDVIVGGILGHSIGRMVVARERSAAIARRPLDAGNFTPIVDPDGGTYGLAWSWGW